MTNPTTPTEQDNELRRAIVNYRIKCDYYLSDRDEGVISQEEYEAAISGELDTVIGLSNTQKRLYAESVINRIDTAYKYSSLEPDYTPYDAGKNRGLAIAVALLEGNESQVIEDSAEQRARIE